MSMFLNCIIVLASLSVQYGLCESTMFRKCCTQYQNLVKITETNETTIFQCESLDLINLKYGIYTSPLIMSKDIKVTYGMPENCEIEELEVDTLMMLTPEKNICYDKRVLEMKNDEVTDGGVPKTVLLKCKVNELNETLDYVIEIDHIRKCCPRKHVYDDLTKVCASINDDIDEEWLVRKINNLELRIYDVDTGINCKTEQYAIDLLSEKFSLDVYWSSLFVLRDTTHTEQVIGAGEWCMDRRKDNSGLVARVCTNNALDFGAYPIRKCCPEGEHYKVRNCKSAMSMCVPNTDHDLIFNVSMYLDPLKQKDENFPDLLGVRTSLSCPKGKFVADKTRWEDQNSLNSDGTLQIFNRKENNYCIEEFDRRHCYDDNPIDVAAVLCFSEAVQSKDFYLSFVLNTTSAVFLALTLLVYVLLPELHNLHGRIVICYTGSLLLAFSLLAIVQHKLTIDANLCAVLGYSIYFWFVAAFAWINVTCWDIWRTFESIQSVQKDDKFRTDRRFLWYSLYAWSFAIVLTLTTYLLDKYPLTAVLDSDMGIDICWFNPVRSGGWAHIIFFVIPSGLLTCINFVLWVLTARHCARIKSQWQRLQNSIDDNAVTSFNINKDIFILTAKLFMVMGAGWLTETLSIFITEPKWLWEILDCFNELQGVSLFIILILKPRIYYMIKKRLSLGRN